MKYQQYSTVVYRPDRGTINAIYVLCRLVERSIEKQIDVYVCVIDYSKDFDTVNHDPLIHILQLINVDAHDNKLLANRYWNEQAAVRHNGEISTTIYIKQRVLKVFKHNAKYNHCAWPSPRSGQHIHIFG